MRNKIKIIDLLVKISKDEKTPEYVRYRNYLTGSFNTMMVCKENLICKLDQLEIYLNDEVEILDDEEDKEVQPLTKKDIEALGYACGEIKKCFENGWNKSLKNEPFEEEDKDIPLIPDDELYDMSNVENYKSYEKLAYNFKVLQEKINQVVEELNKRQ